MIKLKHCVTWYFSNPKQTITLFSISDSSFYAMFPAKVCLVGIGSNLLQSEVDSVTTSQANVISVDSYESLDSNLDSISECVCGVSLAGGSGKGNYIL